MTTTFTQRTASDAGHSTPAKGGGVECLCPFCGAFNSDIGRPCRHCGTEDTTAARGAARKRVGPWFVLQSKNPAAPGMSLQSLLALIRGGLVTERSVIRGPATGQLWRLAGKVRGISREFGSCYGCSGDLYAGDAVCPHCQRPQSLPADIDAAPEPAPAPAADRRPPRQDLLTPRDVAKAFSIGYGPGLPASTVTLNDLLPPNPPSTARPRPTLLAVVTVAATVGCFGWVLIHSLGGRRAAPAVAQAAELPTLPTIALPPIVHVTPADRRLVLPPPMPTNDEPTVRPAMLVNRAPAAPPAAPPAVPVVIQDDPVVVTTASTELAPSGTTDDPKQLMAAGLAAEARGDYAAAVKEYERIESLSSDEWPTGLRDRLSLARAAARGD